MVGNRQTKRYLLSGNQAVALAARHSAVALGVAYPGTPSTEILENFSEYGGQAEWAPNEKVALEVGVGAAYGRARVLVTMKHVGVNVAADPLFTCAYTGVDGGLVLVSADDPGMASSQNEQDNRRYAVAAGLPMLEPADSQEAYEFTRQGFEISERWGVPVILRLTTRICHSQTVVETEEHAVDARPQTGYQRDIKRRVMIPAYARPAHRVLRQKLAKIAEFNETSIFPQVHEGRDELAIITSGVCFNHVREAAPEANILKLGMTHPLPLRRIAEFASNRTRCLVIEEADPYLYEAIRAAGIASIEGKPEMYRFGELNVGRIRRIIAGDQSAEPQPTAGRPPQLCQGCPHRVAFAILRELECIVTGDIGCYTLGVLPPFEAMDTCLCMGASIGVGLGLRHVLPEQQARKVVSVIGDSTFVHSGITGLVEMAYNRPKTGHTVMILDNNTTAMTGLQEHPGTGRSLNYSPAHKLDFAALAQAIGIDRVVEVDPNREKDKLRETLKAALAGQDLNLIIVRSPCLLGIRKARKMAEAAGQPG